VRLLRCDMTVLRRACLNLCQKDHESVCRYFSSASGAEGEQSDDIESLDAENDEEMAARDISRMPKKYRDRMKHVMIAPEKPDWYAEMFQSVAHKRSLYVKYGRKSGLDPGILWPSKEEVEEQTAFEKDWEPSLDEMLKSLQQERADAEKAREVK